MTFGRVLPFTTAVDPIEAIARIRRDHEDLRQALRQVDEAIEDLELRSDADAVAEFASLLHGELAEQFPREEKLARTLLGEDSPLVTRLLVDHRDLEGRMGRIQSLIARAQASETRMLDELRLEVLQLHQTLCCHLCRKESSLLPALCEQAQVQTPCRKEPC